MSSRYGLDPLGRVTVQEGRHTSGHYAAKIRRTYAYDRLGNLMQTETQYQTNPPEIHRYAYDELGRIAAMDDEIFHFDPAHNIIDRHDKIVKNNRITEHENIHYEYDTFGNLIKIQESDTEYRLFFLQFKKSISESGNLFALSYTANLGI